MKTLRWVLLLVCVLKIASFSLCLLFKPNSKEIKQFFEKELYRKYNDHSIEVGYISAASHESIVISRDSTNHYLGNRDEAKWPFFKRTMFQDYVRYLRGIDTVSNKVIDIDLKCYPKLLRNTVAEENAKREIFSHLKNMRLQNDAFNNAHLMGLLTGINILSDSMQIRLVPFAYNSQLRFDYCKCDNKTLIIKDNPFYYPGSLFNWECTFQHPKIKEIQIYGLKPVE